MTACLYISPGNVPMLMSDAMVTGPVGRADMVLPSNFFYGSDRKNLAETRLARKLFLVQERTAFAFAGCAEQVLDCLQGIPAILSVTAEHERPLMMVADRANGYGDDVEMLGVYVPAVGRQRFHKVHLKTAEFELPFLGECAFSGSGGRRLRETAAFLDKSHPPWSEIDAATLGIHALSAAQAMSATRLFEEIVHPEDRNSYGGYLEYAYFDPGEEHWVRGPPSVYFFYQALIVEPGVMTLRMMDRAIAYEPGGRSGRVLAVTFRDYKEALHEWRLGNIVEGDDQQLAPTVFWPNWRPSLATIVISPPPGRMGPCCKSIFGLPHDDVHFSVGPPLRVGVGASKITKIASEIAAGWGLAYQHGADLPDR